MPSKETDLVMDFFSPEVEQGLRQEIAKNFQPGGLRSLEETQKQAISYWRQGFTDFYERIQQAIEHLANKQETVFSDIPPINFRQLRETIDANPTSIPQNLLGISNDALLAIYEEAKEQTHQKHLPLAADLFLFCTALNPYISLFWLALARTEKWLHRKENAEVAYLLAFATHSEDLSTLLEFIDFLIEEGKKSDAIAVLEKIPHLLPDADANFLKEVNKKKQAI